MKKKHEDLARDATVTAPVGTVSMSASTPAVVGDVPAYYALPDLLREIPIVGSPVARSVTCDADAVGALVHVLLMSYFEPVINELDRTKSGRRSRARHESLVALANWAAASLADEAKYSFLEFDLPSFLGAAADAALHAAVRRAIDNLSRLQPSGEFGLRNAAERATWNRLASRVPRKAESRMAIAELLFNRIRGFLAEMQDPAGRKHGSKDSTDAPRRRKRQNTIGKIDALIAARRDADLGTDSRDRTSIEAWNESASAKRLARELRPNFPDLKKRRTLERYISDSLAKLKTHHNN